jgi:hypothetical protein
LLQLPTPVHLIHYLDDFLFLVAPHSDTGNHVSSLALDIFTLLGIPVALHKTACVIVFLGILIDSVAGELRLPTGELQPQELSSEEDMFQEGVGLLSGSSLSCATPGRAFLRELFNLLLRGKQLSGGARWMFFLQHWSGHSFSLLLLPIVFSDASGSWGGGGFTEDVGWFQAHYLVGC